MAGLLYASGLSLSRPAAIVRQGGRLVFSTYELDSKRPANIPIVYIDPVGDYHVQQVLDLVEHPGGAAHSWGPDFTLRELSVNRPRLRPCPREASSGGAASQ